LYCVVAGVWDNCETNGHRCFRKLNICIQPWSFETLYNSTLTSALNHEKSGTAVEPLTRKMRCIELRYDGIYFMHASLICFSFLTQTIEKYFHDNMPRWRCKEKKTLLIHTKMRWRGLTKCQY
jgi:hypothetical protein